MLTTVLQEKEQYLNDYTSYARILYKKSDKTKISEYAAFRNIQEDSLKPFGMFYIQNPAELLLPQYTDKLPVFGIINRNNYPVFSSRYIIPIFDTRHRVQNLVGYSNTDSQRYVYATGKFYSRTDTLYGLENLHKAYEMGYAIVTEGITDAQRIRTLGYANCFAMCGTHSSDFIIEQLNRCRYGVICIPDRDNPGLKALAKWNFRRKIHLFIQYKYKDADEMLRTDEAVTLFKARMNECIEYLKRNTASEFTTETTII